MNIQQVKNQFPESIADIEMLESLGFSSRSHGWIETLNPQQAEIAVWLMGKVGNDDDADTLMGVLSSQSRELWMHAATALSLIATTKHLTGLFEILTRGVDVSQRESAAYTVSFLTNCQINPELIQVLTEIAGNKNEPPSLRSQALEGLGNKLSEDIPTNLYDSAVQVMLESLDDLAAEVRFWGCFAVGAVVVEQALPKLQRLAQTDHTIIPGWWSVAKEAADSISLIQGLRGRDEN
ncbi:HEAT repeat domain-containing protein [Calothrix sp. 336/3]|uniref:HEAT repeat domain-containing protein n=1 Tax=Calothrix sp. 336/3 TaxID=1337936 RepID=UPI0004E31699|nr:HEAT repeat domain-containing protein [Calothrix sp. 336/3]AKG20511.1 hypothetical protein IJ00_03555 [Calothrix sp. 336/3]